MSIISSSTENKVPNLFQEPLISTEENKNSSPLLSGIKRSSDGEFKVPSPLLKKAKKEGIATPPANPETSPPLSVRTGKPLSPETVRYIEEMKRKMDAALAERQKPELDKINAIWQKGCKKTESKK